METRMSFRICLRTGNTYYISVIHGVFGSMFKLSIRKVIIAHCRNKNTETNFITTNILVLIASSQRIMVSKTASIMISSL